MTSLHDGVLADRTVSRTDATQRSGFKRALVAIADASQVDCAADLARRAGAGQARVLHLNLRESMGGRRFDLETDSSATGVVEAAVLELRMAGIDASGHVRHALIDRAAEAIIAEAVGWDADLIVLGSGRRREFATRLFGSATLRVLRHAPCPVLVAPPARNHRAHQAA
jgi:nucleotide-binding universal stress UspA family protein